MRATRPPALFAASPKLVAFAGAGLGLGVLLAYANSLSGPFVFDDVPSIIDNPTLRQLWPWWKPLAPPPEALGLPVGGRPLVNLSLALNYALGGAAPAGYHVFNLVIHLLATLALFGVVRRTLLLPALRERSGPTSLGLACSVAALWSLHPLQTESVTYICQRAESLMALCYFTTLYAFIRSIDAPRPFRWQVFLVTVCLLGMACKEVMVSAPIVVLLYDRTFVAGTFVAAWRLRWRIYLTLSATWALLAWLVLGNLHRGGTAGFETGVTPWTYALTQIPAIIHYLRLALWPRPLVFDYGISTATDPAVVIWPGVLLIALLTLTLYALVRRPYAGFVGAWFFLILAPTSSIVPVATQTMAEHRMYLPLASVIVLLVLGLHRLAGRHLLLTSAALAIVLGGLTARRNTDYHSALGLWADTIAKRPDNARAHSNLGILLFEAGHPAEALEHLTTALRLRPDFPEARANAGTVYLRLGHPREALPQLAEAVRLKPDFAEAHSNLGLALKQVGRPDEATREFREALRLRPDYVDAHHNLAIALLEANQLPESLAQFEITVRLKPDFAEAHSNLGVALMRAGRFDEALAHYETALHLNPTYTAARENLEALKARLNSTTTTVR